MEVREVRARGKAYADGPLVVRILPNQTEPPQNRYAVIAGKRVGKAVQRNRAKRLVREALRTLHPQLSAGYDLVVIVRGTPEELPNSAAALSTLERILTRARLLPLSPESPPVDARPAEHLRKSSLQPPVTDGE